MQPRRLIQYSPTLIQILHTRLPLQIMAENNLVASLKEGHQAEATVQHLIVKLIIPHIPSPDLIKNNEQALKHPTLGKCIPDLIIDRVGGSVWGYIELKTLLTDDQLTEKAVEHDLRKLCAYKVAQPDAAAVFMLVGTRKRLSSAIAKTAWEKAGIKSDDAVFSTGKIKPQKIFDGNHIAIPCGWSGKQNEVMTLAWEIQPANKIRFQSSTYRFLAVMAGEK